MSSALRWFPDLQRPRPNPSGKTWRCALGHAHHHPDNARACDSEAQQRRRVRELAPKAPKPSKRRICQTIAAIASMLERPPHSNSEPPLVRASADLRHPRDPSKAPVCPDAITLSTTRSTERTPSASLDAQATVSPASSPGALGGMSITTSNGSHQLHLSLTEVGESHAGSVFRAGNGGNSRLVAGDVDGSGAGRAHGAPGGAGLRRMGPVGRLIGAQRWRALEAQRPYHPPARIATVERKCNFTGG